MRLFGLIPSIALLASAATLDRVAVVVGKDVLTEGEVEDELRLEEFTASTPLDLGPARRHAAADRLVDQQLIRREMEISRFQEPPPEEAAGMLKNFRDQHFHSEAEFQTALQKYGISQDQLKEYFRWQLAALRFTDARFRPAVPQPEPQSADRAASESAPRAPNEPKNDPSPAEQSADRTPASPPASANNDVDALLDAWLQQARGTTRIEFKKEAFQ